jgi:hypothetical protein
MNSKKFGELLVTLRNVQSSKRSFRPIFVLTDSEHMETLRYHGFTFEVICSPTYAGASREEQIDLFKAKWGATLCLDLDHLQSTDGGLSH